MRTIAFLIAVTLSVTTFATNETVLKSAVKKVTVFLNSAQVYRSAEFSANTGITELIFEGVSPYIDTRTIQVSGKGEYTILDVQYRVKQPEIKDPQVYEIPAKIIKDIELLNDSLTLLDFDLENIANKRDVLNTERKILLANPFMQGNADTIPELILSMDYLRKQLNDINTSLNTLKKQEFVLLKQKTRMETRLSELSNYNAHVNPVVIELPKHQVVVTIQSDLAVAGTISISYMVSNAGWTPAYDIRATAVGQPVKLIQKANVFQNTGEDWKNAKLKLSTITPNPKMIKPILPVFYIGYYNPYTAYQQTDDKRKYSENERTVTCGTATTEFATDANALTSANYATPLQTMTSVEYDIDLAYTIPSDGKTHIVAIGENELKAEFVHYLVPRLDKQAYLIAKITDFGGLDLLPAPASIYFEGTFVGETQINTSILSDTMEISLGVDRGLIVERKKAPDQEKNALIGSNVVKTVKYDLIIKSNKLINTTLIIEDQLPLSQDASIIIEKVDIGGANHDETNGMLTWRMKLSPKQTKTVTYTYTIEYDKNKSLMTGL